MGGRTYPAEMAGADGWTAWIRPLPGYRMACCDCCLVHELDVRIDDAGQVNIRMRRAQRSTASLRRARGVALRRDVA